MGKENQSDLVCTNCGSGYDMAEINKPNSNNDKEFCEVCGTELLSWKADHNSGLRLVRR